MKTRGLCAVAFSALLAAFAGSASASPVTMNYCVQDAGGGFYQYTFTMTLDNHDNSWVPGYGIGWIVFADAPSGQVSPLNDFQGDPSSLPIGPWDGYSTTGGGHNGPNLSPVVVQTPPYPPLYWTPNAVGDSLTWQGISTHLVTPDQMQWSALLVTGGAGVNFENMTNVCGPVGGCCLPTGCQVLSSELCASLGGNYSGDGTDCSACPPVGSCCISGACSTLTEAACTTAGGSWGGAGSTCPVSNYDIASSTGTFVDISSTGTLEPVTSGCDDCVSDVALPFPFTFFGNTYNDVFIDSNGTLQFGTSAQSNYLNDNPPSAATPNNAIYPLWDDLYYDTGGIYYQTDGVAPNRTFTVAWINRSEYGLPGTSLNFEVILSETTNGIEFRYGDIPTDVGGENGPDGSDYTVGVENAAGTVAATVDGIDLGSGNTARTFTFHPQTCGPRCGSADFDCNGDVGTDSDISAFFSCLAGNCPPAPCTSSADFNGDGDVGTDEDISAFFRVLAGGNC